MLKNLWRRLKESDRKKNELWAKKSVNYKTVWWIIFVIGIAFIGNRASFLTDKFKLSFGIEILIAMGMAAILGLILKIWDIIYTKRTRKKSVI